MAANTKIQWAHHTFNPWRGCMKVASGCANCYAEAQSKRNPKTLGIWGPNGTRVVASEAMWREPVKWNKVAAALPDTIVWPGSLPVEHVPVERLRVFSASLADVFEEWTGAISDSRGRRLHVAPSSKWCAEGLGSPVRDSDWQPLKLDDVRARLFRLIDATPHLDWLLLTKRPENIARMTPGLSVDTSLAKGNYESRCRRKNVWLGTSIACQEDADRNIPELLKCRDLARNLFLSIEPLVGPVDLSKWLGLLTYSPTAVIRTMPNGMTYPHPSAGQTVKEYASLVDWVIVGGESGPNARPCNIEWIRSIVEQCKDAGVPCFVKQLGAQPIEPDGSGFVRHSMVCDPKGGDPVEWPADLRVREIPS